KLASDHPEIVAIENGGVLRALAAGTATVTATLDGKTTTTEVSVPSAASESGISFINEVMPVLSRAGCNAGSCHAKPEGQNGFKLSVFSYDPGSDYAHIVKDARGRRVFPAAPDESLIIRKPTTAIPHEGGLRFERGSETHQLLV